MRATAHLDVPPAGVLGRSTSTLVPPGSSRLRAACFTQALDGTLTWLNAECEQVTGLSTLQWQDEETGTGAVFTKLTSKACEPTGIVASKHPTPSTLTGFVCVIRSPKSFGLFPSDATQSGVHR